MIEFIELEPYKTLNETQDAVLTHIPVCMVKDGARHYIMSRTTTSPTDSTRLDACKKELIKNDGRYFMCYGEQPDPEKLIEGMLENGHSFNNPDDLFHCEPPDEQSAGFTDFRGSINDASPVFRYRIYDKSYAVKLRQMAKLVNILSRQKNKSGNGGSAVLLSRDGKLKGVIMNPHARRCQLEGCRAYRASVRWEDGSLTYPCMAGVKAIGNGIYQII